MATVRTKEYFLNLFRSEYLLQAEDMDDLVESVAFAADLADLEEGAPTGPAGGMLTGSYPDPVFIQILPEVKTVVNPRVTVDIYGRVTALESQAAVGDQTLASTIKTVAPLAEANVQAQLESFKADIDNQQSGSSIKEVSFSVAGVMFRVKYYGEGFAPIGAGSQGDYQITMQVGTRMLSVRAAAETSDGGTDDGDIAITIVNVDGHDESCSVMWKDLSNGQLYGPGGGGVTTSQSGEYTGSISTVIESIGPNSAGFIVYLNAV